MISFFSFYELYQILRQNSMGNLKEFNEFIYLRELAINIQ